MESAIEVRYAGVTVGRATQVKDWTAGGAFVGFTEPLPTGTTIELRGENIAQPARVDEVLESSDPSIAGMRVSFLTSSAPPSPSPSAPPSASSAAPSSPPPEPAPPQQPQHQGGSKRKRRR